MVLSQMSKQKLWLFVALGAALVALSLGAAWLFSRPSVSGATADEKISSICRLADERPAGAAQALATAAQTEPDPAVRQAAYSALAKFGGPEVRPVVDRGAADASPAVRTGAARALSAYNDDAAATRLAKLLNDANEETAIAAAQSLATIDRPIATAALAKAIQAENKPAVKKQAAVSLYAKMGIRLKDQPDPGNNAKWNGLVKQAMKFTYVQDAIRETGSALEGQ